MEVGTIDTALGLLERGADPVVFADAAAVLPDRAEVLRDRIVRLDPLPRALQMQRSQDALFLPTKLAFARRWAVALHDNPVDVVHTFSPGCAALIPRGTPTVVQAWFNPPTLRARLRTMLAFAPKLPPVYLANVAMLLQSHSADALAYRRADVILTNTATAEGDFRGRGYEARRLPPSIEVPSGLPERRPADRLRIAFCAHPLDRPRKGLLYLLDALGRLEDGTGVELTLIGGSSPELEEPIARAQRNGALVRLLGRVPRDRYLDHLARDTDLLAFTSLYEEWGYALFEAFSRGVPAVTFDLYPFHDIVDEDTGRLVAPRDSSALARALDAARHGALPEPAAVLDSTRRRFGSLAIAEQLIAVYEGLVASRSR
jgi:glycosyltransferase involved in cell wall biosynthesis